jgi:hypothetical protein
MFQLCVLYKTIQHFLCTTHVSLGFQPQPIQLPCPENTDLLLVLFCSVGWKKAADKFQNFGYMILPLVILIICIHLLRKLDNKSISCMCHTLFNWRQALASDSGCKNILSDKRDLCIMDSNKTYVCSDVCWEINSETFGNRKNIEKCMHSWKMSPS